MRACKSYDITETHFDCTWAIEKDKSPKRHLR